MTYRATVEDIIPGNTGDAQLFSAEGGTIEGAIALALEGSADNAQRLVWVDEINGRDEVVGPLKVGRGDVNIDALISRDAALRSRN